MIPSPATRIPTRDGREVSVEISGAETGVTVFLMHGTPGSRLGPKLRPSFLHQLGVRLVCYDRPGYGESSRHIGRFVADAARDVERIADRLGVERFSVVGRSGGGPHALATAAILEDRVDRVAALVCLAPHDAPGLDWFSGMTDANVRAYTTADQDEPKLIESLRLQADRARRNPTSMLDGLRGQMTAPDKTAVQSSAMRGLLTDTYREAMRTGPYGWIDDVLALRRDWGFDPRKILQPTLLWHGERDNFSPVEHTLWLAEQIDNAEVRIQRDTAHFGAMEELPTVLGWLAGAPERILEPAGRYHSDQV
ncbi:alpha/beta hydrolase [Asanoa ishikariensis]|uniref:Pimeloyl-ACP methyl ester carboxylesterase n=1 Tax=Asanoa ishikariensis TaxID=137265 RepID=A0A1H3L8R1_9ACTN|nr:alpha/beta hydrolase [Asanoa ishikariensis]GIF65317.1 alpha/beta hydrolase [Asanoa ishikariensis]SDY60579.1 Pimeloyl-ACP methyl ester carboxylesterase [Asanoa ishikariensis]